MKARNIAAAALMTAAGTGAVQAQSTVTLYGVADVNVEYANHVGAVPVATNQFNRGQGHDVVRMNSGGLAGSRWGIRGTEDLGGGAKAMFVLESGFSLDSGTLQQSACTCAARQMWGPRRLQSRCSCACARSTSM